MKSGSTKLPHPAKECLQLFVHPKSHADEVQDKQGGVPRLQVVVRTVNPRKPTPQCSPLTLGLQEPAFQQPLQGGLHMLLCANNGVTLVPADERVHGHKQLVGVLFQSAIVKGPLLELAKPCSTKPRAMGQIERNNGEQYYPPKLADLQGPRGVVPFSMIYISLRISILRW